MKNLFCMYVLNVHCRFVLQEIRVEKLLAIFQWRKTDEGQQTTKGVGELIYSHWGNSSVT